LRREELVDLVQPLLDREGFELVECSISRHQRSQVIRLSVDREGGVAIDACGHLSREISDLLDARPLLRGAYHLEVSSAGMNRPVWKPEHFLRFQGEEVRVDLAAPSTEQRGLRGVIGPVQEDGVWILEEKGERRFLRWMDLGRAHLHMDPWGKRPGGAPPTPGKAGTSRRRDHPDGDAVPPPDQEGDGHPRE
jgi:ribosome maturation factor RimP